MQLGIIGLGKMGASLALNAEEHDIEVVGKDIKPKPELSEHGITVVTEYVQFVALLTHPRIIFLSLPAGKMIDGVLQDLVPLLQEGDVVLDGGNSFFMDSVRREKELWDKKIYFIDCGTSGGVSGARHGACFMVGGKKEGVSLAEPVLKSLAVKDGFVHAGKPGAGHFVKLVHNGIEFGMLQAIGEGMSLLTHSDYDLDLEKILHNCNHGSVIRSWLVELLEEGIKNQNISQIQSYIEDTGEVNWLVQYAINRELPIPIISQSIMELFRSRNPESDIYRSIAAMRHGFGGHPYGKSEYLQKERKTSRLSPL